MVHELKKIIECYSPKAENTTAVLATVVALDGSSYRRPGVRMLIWSDGSTVGAVSGGCVEKEICRQAESVFKGNTAKMMTYDGRYRLGCEGILYILIEPFAPDERFISAFKKNLSERTVISVRSYYKKEYGSHEGLGTQFYLDGEWQSISSYTIEKPAPICFEQQMEPCHKLIIIGAEHDAVELCRLASLTGWEVTIIAPPSEEKTIAAFPGATEFLTLDADNLDPTIVDGHTSIILMTHSYVKDLSFVLRLSDTKPGYFGLLGPESRREKLLNEFLERKPETDVEFVENVYGPAGLDIGAETAQEIAVSVIAEILSVYRQTKPSFLKDKKGAIHNP